MFIRKKNKRIDDLTEKEWEAVCDRCGKCCCYKYLIEETGELEYGDPCELLTDDNLCSCYETRTEVKPDCLKLTPENIRENVWWMPETCAYRKLVESEEK